MTCKSEICAIFVFFSGDFTCTAQLAVPHVVMAAGFLLEHAGFLDRGVVVEV